MNYRNFKLPDLINRFQNLSRQTKLKILAALFALVVTSGTAAMVSINGSIQPTKKLEQKTQALTNPTTAPTSTPAAPPSVPKPAKPTKAGDPSPTSTPVATVVPDAPVIWDYFMRSDRNLGGDIGPTGVAYVANGPVAPVLRSNRFVRADPSKTGNFGHSILLTPHSVAPTIVTGQYVFTPGTTLNGNAVIAACAQGLGKGSVQFAVWPDSWELFTVIPRSTPDQYGNTATFTTIGKGTISPKLLMDGQTRYTSIMTYNPATSSVTVQWGDGQTRTFTNSDPVTGLTANWGSYSVAQIRHPLSSDGDVQFTAIGSN